MHLSEPLKDFLSLSLDAVAVTHRDNDGHNATLVYVNDAYCRLFGRSFEEAIGQPASIGHDPEDWRLYCNQLMPVIAAGGTAYKSELRCRRADGGIFWASISLFRVEAPDQDGFYSCVTFRDISDLKAREEAAERAIEERENLLAVKDKMNEELQASQQRLESALNAYPDPFVIYDEQLRLVTANTAYRKSMSAVPERIRPGMHVREALNEAIDSGFLQMGGKTREELLDGLLSEATMAREVEDFELAGDVHNRVLRSRASNGDWVIIRVNTTEVVRQSRVLHDTQERLVTAINAIPDPFAIYDCDLNLLIWNPAFVTSITENAEDVRVGMNVAEVVALAVANGRVPAARGRESSWLREYDPVSAAKVEAEDFEFAGDTHYRIMRSLTETGETVVLRLNITESVRQRRALEEYAEKLEQANQDSTYKALHDELTGLGNRRYLENEFAALSTLRRDKGGELAALHIDLDRFKQINDTIGHAAGDHVLLDVAQRIKTTVGEDGIIARIGGDEFVIVVHITDDQSLPDRLADQLMKTLSRPSTYHGRECRFGASIGIARTPVSDESGLLTNSDVALYKAKNAGRGQIGSFDAADIDEIRQTKQLADDIMRGLEAGEFVPFYQPQIDAKTGCVAGVEVLARWDHPKSGILAPDHFLPIATDLNAVSDIDRMIFESAIEECKRGFHGLDWFPSLSFNVSANRISDHAVEEIGKLAGSYPGEISFELLETIFLEEENEAFLATLEKIRGMGISLEVDDFGSGRASIVALQRIAPDQLKIDRRLISPMDESNNAARLVKSIIDIGHALNIGVIAEGVETKEQADLLAKLGAARLQGYYFSKPLSIDSLVVYLERNQPKRLLKVGT